MLDFYSEFARIVETLESHSVDYAICGGLAVMIHGYVRATVDIDILIRSQALESAKSALNSIGFDLAAGPIPFAAGTPQRRVLHRVSKAEGSELLTVDLMLVTPVLEPAWSNRVAVSWKNRQVRVVSREGLAHMKRLAGRRKDLLDLEALGLGDAPDMDED